MMAGSSSTPASTPLTTAKVMASERKGDDNTTTCFNNKNTGGNKDDNDDVVWSLLSTASRQNDATRIATLLEQPHKPQRKRKQWQRTLTAKKRFLNNSSPPPSSAWNEELIGCSPAVARVLNRLFRRLPNNISAVDGEGGQLYPDPFVSDHFFVVRALLLPAAAACETPWRTADALIRSLHDHHQQLCCRHHGNSDADASPGNMSVCSTERQRKTAYVRSNVAAVQSFLQQAIPIIASSSCNAVGEGKGATKRKHPPTTATANTPKKNRPLSSSSSPPPPSTGCGETTAAPLATPASLPLLLPPTKSPSSPPPRPPHASVPAQCPKSWILKLVQLAMDPLLLCPRHHQQQQQGILCTQLEEAEEENQPMHEKQRTTKAAEVAAGKEMSTKSSNKKESNLSNTRRNGSSSAENDEFWVVPLEVISTIISSLSSCCSTDNDDSGGGDDDNDHDRNRRDDDDETWPLLSSCLDVVFQQPIATTSMGDATTTGIRPDRLLPWVRLALELRLFLRDKDWEHLQRSLQNAFLSRASIPTAVAPPPPPPVSTPPFPRHDNHQHTDAEFIDNTQQFPQTQDLAELIKIMVTLSTLVEDEENVSFWQNLTLQLFWMAATVPAAASSLSITPDSTVSPSLFYFYSLEDYASIEATLQSSLDALPSSHVQKWSQAVAAVALPLPTAVANAAPTKITTPPAGTNVTSSTETPPPTASPTTTTTTTLTSDTKINTDTGPHWLRANLLLKLSRASQRRAGSHLVATMVAQSFAPRRPGEREKGKAAERNRGELPQPPDNSGGDDNDKCQSNASRERTDNDVNQICWNGLVHLVFNEFLHNRKRQQLDDCSETRKFNNDKNCRIVSDLNFEGASYVGKGRFENQAGKNIPVLTAVGMLVFQSLSIGGRRQLAVEKTAKENHPAIERAQTWVQAALDSAHTSQQFMMPLPETRPCLIRHHPNSKGDGDNNDSYAWEEASFVLALCALTVVYCEMPALRSSLMRQMRRGLTPSVDISHSYKESELWRGGGPHVVGMAAVRPGSLERNPATSLPMRRTKMPQLFCLVLSIVLRKSHSAAAEHTNQEEELWNLLFTDSSNTSTSNLHPQRRLPWSLFLVLVTSSSLSTLPSARPALLAAARAYVQPTTYTYEDVNSFYTPVDGGNTNTDVQPTVGNAIQCGLWALVTLMMGPSLSSFATGGDICWDHCSMEAWNTISTLIVECRPPLPLAARTWLYQELQRSLSLLIKSQSSSSHRHTYPPLIEHILCACLVRMLSFVEYQNGQPRLLLEKAFIVWGGGGDDDEANRRDGDCSTHNTLHKQAEDFCGLLDLMMYLLHTIANGNRYRMEGIVAWRNQLLSQVGVWRDEDAKQQQGVVEPRNDKKSPVPNLNPNQRGLFPPFCTMADENDDTHFTFHVALDCIGFVAQDLLELHHQNVRTRVPLQTLVFGPSSTASAVLPTDQQLLQLIIQRLTQDSNKLRNMSSEVEDLLHTVDNKGFGEDGSGLDSVTSVSPLLSAAITDSMLATLRARLCDILLEFVIGPRWSFPVPLSLPAKNLHGNKLRRAALQLANLSAARQNICASLRGGGNDDNSEFHRVTCKNPETAGAVFVAFCSVLAPAIKASIIEGDSVLETDEMICSTLDFCECVPELAEAVSSIFIEDSSNRVLDSTIDALRNIYCVLSEEMSVVQLISRLESSECPERIQSASPPEHGRRHPSSLLLIDGYSKKENGRKVQDMRIRVMEALYSFFSAFARRCPSATTRFEDYIGYDLETRKESSSVKLGAATRSQQQQILTFMEMMSRDLRVGLDGASGGFSCGLCLAYVDCLEVCARILSEAAASDLGYFDDEQQQPCTSSAVLMVYKEMVSLLKEILCSYELKGAALFRKTMDLCLYVLPSIVRSIICSSLLEVEETAVSVLQYVDDAKHRSFLVRSYEQCCGILEGRPFSDEASHTPWGDTNDGDGNSYSRCVSNDFIDANADTSLPLVVFIPSNAHSGSIPSAGGETLQLRNKQVWTWALCSSLDALEQDWAESLHYMQTTVSFRSNYGSIAYYTKRKDELGAALRSVGRSFKCMKRGKSDDGVQKGTPLSASFPEKTKLRMCAVIERIAFVLQRAIKSVIVSISGKNLSPPENKFTNCLSFVEALSCISAWLCQLPADPEFTVGFRRWCIVEKQPNIGPIKQRGNHAAEATLMRRLPKILFKIEELESALDKLLLALRRSEEHDAKGGTNQTQDQVIRDIDDLISQNSEKTKCRSGRFCQMISKKRIRLEKLRLELEADLGGQSMEDHLLSRIRKRMSTENTRQQVGTQQRRRVLRSRNQLVDEWLQEDQDLEEAQPNDAFADLEDFLTKG